HVPGWEDGGEWRGRCPVERFEERACARTRWCQGLREDRCQYEQQQSADRADAERFSIRDNPSSSHLEVLRQNPENPRRQERSAHLDRLSPPTKAEQRPLLGMHWLRVAPI